MPRSKSAGLDPEEGEKLRTDRLLDLAAEVFLELGYEGTSTALIAERAHASKQTFYARFPSKEKLFLAAGIFPQKNTAPVIRRRSFKWNNHPQCCMLWRYWRMFC